MLLSIHLPTEWPSATIYPHAGCLLQLTIHLQLSIRMLDVHLQLTIHLQLSIRMLDAHLQLTIHLQLSIRMLDVHLQVTIHLQLPIRMLDVEELRSSASGILLPFCGGF